jgi:D-alanyl-D-alanine carboxypeptidase
MRTKRIVSRVGLIVLTVCFSGKAIHASLSPEARSASPAVGLSENLPNPYASLYQDIIDRARRKGFPGLVVLVRTPEEGTWIGTSGYARIENKTPMRPETLFWSQSVAKTYTAAAVFMLRDRGLIDLDAKIDAYLSRDICDRVPNGHKATVRQLLNHTSGIPESDDTQVLMRPWNNPYDWTWRDELEALYREKPLFEPGTNRHYDNMNYLLLALIIDELTGSHAGFFSTQIFQPLGMRNTYYKNEPGMPRPPGSADIYFDRFGDGYVENITDEISHLEFNTDYGFSGIVADMADHARFIEALVKGDLISQDSWNEMTIPSFPGYEWVGAGLGMIPYTDGDGKIHIAYEGAGSGMSGFSYIFHMPSLGLTVCYSTNIGSMNNEEKRKVFDQIRVNIIDVVMNRRTALRADDERNIEAALDCVKMREKAAFR